MTSPEQRQWDLLTGPTNIDLTSNVASTPPSPGSSEWVDERIKTRSEIAHVGQRRLKLSAEETAGLNSKIDTFVEVHRLATSNAQFGSARQDNRGVPKWMKLAAAAAVVLPAAISLGASPAAAMPSPDTDFEGLKDPGTDIGIDDLGPTTGLAEDDGILVETTKPGAVDNSCLVGPGGFELHVQPDGSSYPGADLCELDGDARPVVPVPDPVQPEFDLPSKAGAAASSGPSRQSLVEMLEQARADLDCDIGVRDMMFDPESDVCDALTAAQIRYQNELDKIVSDFDETPVIDGVGVRHSCDGISDIAYGAVKDHCDSLAQARQAYKAEVDSIVSEATQPGTVDDSCLAGPGGFELHVQPDGSSYPGADLCELDGDARPAISAPDPVQPEIECFGWEYGTPGYTGPSFCDEIWFPPTPAAVPGEDKEIPDPNNEVLSAEKLAEEEWKKAKAAPDWKAKKEAEAIWKAKLESEKEAAAPTPIEPQIGLQCFDADRIAGGIGQIPCQPYVWHPQPGQEIIPRCSVDDWFSDEPWHDSYCDVDYAPEQHYWASSDSPDLTGDVERRSGFFDDLDHGY